MSTGVHDVLTTVLRDVFAVAGHHRTEQVLCTDDQAELLARVESQTQRRKVYLDLHALAGPQLVDSVESVHGDVVGGQRLVQLTHGHAQATIGSLVAQYRSAPL